MRCIQSPRAKDSSVKKRPDTTPLSLRHGFEPQSSLFFYTRKPMGDYIETGLVWLRNYHARDIAHREAALIAHDIGFSKARILPQEEIISLIPRTALNITKNERSSFYRDLIIEATDV